MPDTTPSPVGAVLNALRRRWLLAVLSAVAVVVVWVPFVLALPDLYRASATILVAGHLSDSINQSAEAGSLDLRLQAIKQQSLSRAQLTELLDRFHLYPEMHPEVSSADAIGRLQKDIQLEITSTSQRSSGGNDTVAFKLSYLGRDPATVAEVTNTLASYYVAQNSSLRAKAADETLEFLNTELAAARAKLDLQEKRVSALTNQNAAASPQQLETTQAALGRISLQLQSNINEQLRERERRQGLLSQIADVRSSPAAAESDPDLQLENLRREVAELRLTETESSPNVKAKQRQIDALIRQIQSNTSRSAANDGGSSKLGALQASLADADLQLQKLAREQEALQTSMKEYQARIERAPARNIEFDAIMQDYRAARDLFDSVQKRYDTAAINARAERGQVGDEFRILDDALTPLAAAGPNRRQLFVVGVVLAIVFGAAVAFLRDRLDSSFHSRDELRAFTNVPVLATIPVIGPTRHSGALTLRVGAFAAAAAMLVAVVAAGAFRYAQGNETIARMLLPRG